MFNFEGAYRYELIEEYYPRAFDQIRRYVKTNRWNPAGAEYENGDVNIPSPEAITRNILLGNNYFYEKFKKKVRIYFCLTASVSVRNCHKLSMMPVF